MFVLDGDSQATYMTQKDFYILSHKLINVCIVRLIYIIAHEKKIPLHVLSNTFSNKMMIFVDIFSAVLAPIMQYNICYNIILYDDMYNI